ncbi:MAG: carbohydrate ABC transporter permease [Chloroflexota bacterium]
MNEALAEAGPGTEGGQGVSPASVAQARRSAWQRLTGEGQGAYLAYLTPTVVVLFVVTVLPLIYLFVTSFTGLNLTKADSFQFTGLENYGRAVEQDRFWNSVWVQLRLSFWTVSLQLVIGLGLAWLLGRQARFVETIRAFFIIPMVLPPVVVAVIWKILFTPDISVLNWVLGLVGMPQPAWLADPSRALWALIIADTWEWFPFVLLILLAAMQMLPTEPMEAARIDGCSEWQLFWYVMLPLLRPALLVAALFRLMDSMKAFPHIFIMTSGGPGKVTEATNFFAYLQAYSYSFVGFSSAIVVMMVIFIFALSLLLIRMVGTEVEIE